MGAVLHKLARCVADRFVIASLRSNNIPMGCKDFPVHFING
jgi:hypothetical protein